MIMSNKLIRIVVSATLLFSQLLIGSNYTTTLARSNDRARKGKQLKLIAEFKKNFLQDISSDGKFILLYQTNVPMRSYTIPLDGRKPSANQSGVGDDMLRIVDLENGREISSVPTTFFPTEEQFIPNTHQVFYKEPTSSYSGSLYKVWDTNAKQVAKVCPETTDKDISKVNFVNEKLAYGVLRNKEKGHKLISISLPECQQTILGSVDPSETSSEVNGQIILSPDKRQLAYSLGGHEVVVWDTVTKQIAKELNVAPLFALSKLLFSPDGKYLVIQATTKLYSSDGAKYFLLFFDTSSYQNIRRIELPAYADSLALSPNGEMLAVGLTNKDGQGQIIVYETMSDKEIFKAIHPTNKNKSSDPFEPELRKLIFSPNGRYLVSSTYDTRIWQIE